MTDSLWPLSLSLKALDLTTFIIIQLIISVISLYLIKIPSHNIISNLLHNFHLKL
jgi:hypothetical protein